MRRLSLALLLTLAPAARAEQSDRLGRRVESLVEEASQRLTELARSVAGTREALRSQVPAAAIEDEAYGYCLASPATMGALAQKTPSYYLCKAIIANDPRVCDEMLPPSRISISLKQTECAVAWSHARLGKSIIHETPEVEDFCLSAVDLGPEFPQELRPMLCRYVRNDLRTVCERLQEERTMFRDVQECVDNYELYWGRKSEAACGPSGVNWETRLCVATFRYRRVLERKDPKLCGDSLLCRALTGDARACDEHLALLKEERCRGLGLSKRAAPRHPSPILEELRGALNGTARGLTPAEIGAVDRLDETLRGKRPFAARQCLSDVLLLRTEGLHAVLEQAAAICSMEEPPQACADGRRRLQAIRIAAAELAAKGKRELGD